MKRFIFTFTFLITAFAFVACSKGYTFRQATGNMLPTVQIGDTLFCDPFYYSHSPVERGHIVLINSPDKSLSDAGGKDTKFMFRIVGIGGDKVQIKDGRVLVNDAPLGGAFASERYESDEPVWKTLNQLQFRRTSIFCWATICRRARTADIGRVRQLKKT